MKIGKNTGRYALGILGGGNPLTGGLRTMLAIQQERGQRKHQKELVDRLVSGLSKNNKPNPQGGNKGQDYTDKNKYDKDWPPPAPLKKASNRETLMASSGLTPEQKAPYVREWQRHWDKKDSYTIKDPERLKNLQDLVLYDRV